MEVSRPVSSVSSPTREEAAPKRKLNMEQLLTRIVELMVRHSPRELSFSRVARLSGVSRSTLYYYFGNNRQVMVQEAVRFGMKAFVQLFQFDKDLTYPSWEDFQEVRMRRAVRMVQRYPWAMNLYFRYRNDPGEMGTQIREIEKTYLEKVAQAWVRYQKSPPNLIALRFACYVKLGILYGFANDSLPWELDEEKGQRRLDGIVKQLTLTLKKMINSNHF